MYNIQTVEKEMLDFWKKNKIFEKLRKKNLGGKRWSFIDGPITANNSMGVHHAWGRTYKDLFQRFKSMQGHELRYQNGFDCQGLWVEREEEKSLGLKDKKDIEKFGILEFVNACKERVEKFSKIQTEQSIRLGYWMDWDNSYYTMSDENNLHNWFLLKSYFEKGWLYKGKDAVPWCWRCGTASSKHDIATEGYKEVQHNGLFMRFPLKDEPKTYFIIFTTTPWTVPANVSIAVNENLDYIKVKIEDVNYWIVESRISEIKEEHEVIDKKKGRELEGIEYEMPYMNFEVQKNSPHKVVLWDYASGEEGTGIVHIAPGCGAEDFNLGKREGLPAISPLDESGIYNEGFGNFTNKKYSEVSKMVVKDLEERGFLYKVTKIRHRYPHCWRCGEELVFRLVDEWYIKSDEIRKKLISENKKVNWYPEYGKARQEEWFKNMGDWLISRERYWGLPLPIWICECGKTEVMGSLDELREKAVDKKIVDNLPEIHRPWIDEIKIKCTCGREASRIKDVGDAWLDAGIVPFSTIGPYLKNKKEWERWYPADLISENIPGQFRGWFNALFWSGVSLTGKAPFKALFGYETLKDEKGEEMHKSKGNAIWFDDAVEKAGADPIRLLFCLQDPSQDLRFGYNVLKEPANSLSILYNVSKLIVNSEKTKTKSIEDKWILSRLNNLIKKTTEELENFHPHTATRMMQNFWLNDLSRGYIQIIRDRLSSEDESAKETLKEVYITLVKLCAPIVPFISEKIWQSLGRNIAKEESVHLTEWPKFELKKIDNNLEEQFSNALKIIEIGLAERDKEKIGLRWPLAKAEISTEHKIEKELEEIIERQLNVKRVSIKKGKNTSVSLDTKQTPELEAEGFVREISRRVQVERKNKGLKKEDKISLSIFIDDKIKSNISELSEFLKEKTGSKDIKFIDSPDVKFSEIVIKDKKIQFYFSV